MDMQAVSVHQERRVDLQKALKRCDLFGDGKALVPADGTQQLMSREEITVALAATEAELQKLLLAR